MKTRSEHERIARAARHLARERGADDVDAEALHTAAQVEAVRERGIPQRRPIGDVTRELSVCSNGVSLWVCNQRAHLHASIVS